MTLGQIEDQLPLDIQQVNVFSIDEGQLPATHDHWASDDGQAHQSGPYHRYHRHQVHNRLHQYHHFASEVID
jgi:hypothetical protein